jgi:hypothetical protein
VKLTQRKRRRARRMRAGLTQQRLNEAVLRGDLVVRDARGRVTHIIKVTPVEMDTS